MNHTYLYYNIQSTLKQNYGKKPDTLILNRVKEELAWMQCANMYFTIGFLYELTERLKQMNIPYRVKNSGNASFILYLLGITRINPLPPHYYCPHCHSVIWDNTSKCGIDLRKEKHCKTDGAIMLTDGFNIPWQAHLSCDQEQFFHVSINPTMYENTLEVLNKTGIDIIEYQSSHNTSRYRNVEAGNIILQFNLPQTELEQSPTEYLNTDAFLEIARNHALITTPDLKISINSFADVISYLGILRSSYTSDAKLKALVNTLNYKLSELIACREDLYQYFLEHGCSEHTAFKLMNNVRKGKRFLNNPPPSDTLISKDKWVIEFCKDVLYLPSKADIIENLLLNPTYQLPVPVSESVL
ncbi:MAG: hypothetical protein IJ320_08795 [Phascolarctobacterium sp.]|nr:hypothetical protein [Phascolarctobacterium sp.]